MLEPMLPRDAAAWVAQQLSQAGHRALFAGGCVRDRLLGVESADVDLATSATPEQIRAIFPRAIGVGESFGVMLVRHGGRLVEVATFRADAEYTDGRRPTSVRFAGDQEDALRRDFTINGLFEDPTTGEVIDYVGGRADIQARVLRAIGDPEARLREDRLRALRAVRFAARFSLQIDPATEAAVRAFAPDLAAVSRERIGHEVRRMLAHPTRLRAVELAEAFGLAAAILGESAATVDLSRLAGLAKEAPLDASLAAWLLGRVLSAVPNASGVDDSRQRQRRWRDALVLSNEESAALEGALQLRQRIIAEWSSGDDAARKRMASSLGFASAQMLLEAERWPGAAELGPELKRLSATGLAPAPLVTGDDLVAMGMRPGPRFRPLLDRLYDRQLNGQLRTTGEALEAAQLLLRGEFGDASAGPGQHHAE